ncbi:hypothetical protein [Aurantiacibacter gilvus]|uniref:Uncharacterized protein n=1 Tax=Aurantiacibacter gilvus TaxID=3139141 RepID=A0ABU9IBR5_9SPHN
MPEEIMIMAVTGIIAVGVVALGGILGWIHTTKIKIKNGYPLESMWGKPLHPQLTNEAQERVALLTQENAQLRAEVSSLKDRLGNVERIVTDSGYRLTHDIERLRNEQEAN